MPDRTTYLKLYLPLDEVEQGRLVDRSGNGLDGEIDGKVTLLPDARFGAVVALDGTDRISVPSSASIDFGDEAFTIELWVSAAPDQENSQAPYTSILEKWDGLNGGFPYAIRYQHVDGTVFALRYDQTPALPTVRSSAKVNDGAYHHVALVRSGAPVPWLRLFIDGQPQGAGAPDTTSENTRNAAPLTLGANAAGSVRVANPWQGVLSHLRIYNRALTDTEIKADMLVDQATAAAFTRNHPIEFSLHNANGLSVLPISPDPTGRSLVLDVRNTSGQSVQLFAPAPGALPSLVNHHFSLWFRPGTLSDASLASMTTTTPGWTLSLPSVQSSGVVVIYLLAQSPLTLVAGDSIAITIDRISGATGGTRETQVEFGYQKISYIGQEGVLSGAPLSGTRQTLLTVANAPAALTEITLGSWTIAPSGDDLLFTGPGGKTVRFSADSGILDNIKK